MRKIPFVRMYYPAEKAQTTLSGKSPKLMRLQGFSRRPFCGEALQTVFFYIPDSSCSPLSSALSNAPAAGRFFVLYLYALANSPSLYSRTVMTF